MLGLQDPSGLQLRQKPREYISVSACDRENTTQFSKMSLRDEEWLYSMKAYLSPLNVDIFLYEHMPFSQGIMRLNDNRGICLIHSRNSINVRHRYPKKKTFSPFSHP